MKNMYLISILSDNRVKTAAFRTKSQELRVKKQETRNKKQDFILTS